MSRPRSLVALALLLFLLLTSACASTAVKKTPSSIATPVMTPTPVLTPPALVVTPAHPLKWTAHRLPFVIPLGGIYTTGLSFSQADGATAYACVEAGQNVRVWVTRDKAVHWASADVPGAADSCRVTVDAAQPETAILLTYHAIDDHCMACYHGDYRNYLTRNAGATWTPLAAPSTDTPLYGLLETRDGVTYATASTIPHSACFDCYTDLYASKDGMRAWVRIDADIRAAGRIAYRFWLNDVGEILAETSDTYLGHDELWVTADQGAHWKAWNSTRAGSFLVPPAQGMRFWRACAIRGGVSSTDPPDLPALLCTLDGGVTWIPSGGSVGTVEKPEIAADYIASDGTASRLVYSRSLIGELQRATPGKQGWGSLGELPATYGVVYWVAGAGSDTLWVFSNGAPVTSVYTATYP